MTRLHNGIREFVVPVSAAVAAVLPATYLRITSGSAGALGDAVLFGLAILAAGFLLSWGAEAAEKYIATGFVLAVVALITVLPEYAVDFYYASGSGTSAASTTWAVSTTCRVPRDQTCRSWTSCTAGI